MCAAGLLALLAAVQSSYTLCRLQALFPGARVLKKEKEGAPVISARASYPNVAKKGSFGCFPRQDALRCFCGIHCPYSDSAR